MGQLIFLLFILLLCIVFITLLTSKYSINVFFVLISVSIISGLITLPTNQLIKTIKYGFGHTMESIGLIIILGTAIGVMLDKTGAALSLANYILKKFGNAKAPLAILITGFIIGLPIFCDSGFIVLSSLSNSLSKRTKNAITVMAPCLAIGLYSVHCLIPPHPGAAAAAGIFRVNFGTLMLLGIFIAIPAVISGYFYIKFINKKISGSDEVEMDNEKEIEFGILPNVFLASLPIIVPIILISLKSIINLVENEKKPGLLFEIIRFTGDPVIALCAGLICSFLLLAGKKINFINQVLTNSIEKAGPIIAIIAAGGAFGAIIEATNIGPLAGKYISGIGAGLLVPFIITAILKTAQGSSTVAIITASSIIYPLLIPLGLQTDWGRIFCVLSMGAGSMAISHTNDAYFWVVANFSGISPKLNLKIYSVSSSIMAVVSLLIIYITSLFIL